MSSPQKSNGKSPHNENPEQDKSSKSPLKSSSLLAKRNAEEEIKEVPDIQPVQKRQKTDAGEKKVSNALPEEDGDFNADNQGAEDSFDSDFDQVGSGDDLADGGDDDFDLEAYLKWKKENPDAVNGAPNDDI